MKKEREYDIITGIEVGGENLTEEKANLLRELGLELVKGYYQDLLSTAISENDTEMVETLLEEGETLLEGGIDPNWGTLEAINNNNTQILKMLLQKGAEAHEVICPAVTKNNTEMVRILLDNGASAFTALNSCEIDKDNKELIELCLERGDSITNIFWYGAIYLRYVAHLIVENVGLLSPLDAVLEN